MNKKTFKSAFIFVTILFFLWGFITVLVDSLIPRLREVFTLTYFQAGLVQFAFFGAYFLVSIPAGYILNKIGYKKGIVLGLITMAIGCLLFYPAASYRIFGIFMLGYFVLAAGITILQVAANPYIAVLGSEEGASSRLNLAQAFNSFGTFLAPIAGSILILSDTIKSPEEIALLGAEEKQNYLNAEALTVQSPFLMIALFIIILAIVFFVIKLPKILEHTEKINFSKVFASKNLMLGALGIFFYVGAEVAIGSYLVNYFLEMDMALRITESDFMNSIANLLNSAENKDPKAIVGSFVALYWGGAMVGRFIGAYLTKIMAPAKVLGAFAISAITLIIISMSTSGFIAMWSILAVGLFNSIMFPTIFTLAIEGLDDLKPQASGVLCSMIFGGAIIPPLYGLLADNEGIGMKLAFTVVLLCYAYIFYFARQSRLKARHS